MDQETNAGQETHDQQVANPVDQVMAALGVNDGGEKGDDSNTSESDPAVGDSDTGESTSDSDEERTDYGDLGKLTKQEAADLIRAGLEAEQIRQSLEDEKKNLGEETTKTRSQLGNLSKLAELIKTDPGKAAIVEAVLAGDNKRLLELTNPQDPIDQLLAKLEEDDAEMAKPLRALAARDKESQQQIEGVQRALDNLATILDPILETKLDSDIDRVEGVFKSRNLEKAFDRAQLKKELDAMNTLELFGAVDEKGKRVDTVMKTAMRLFGGKVLQAMKEKGAEEEKKRSAKLKGASTPKSGGGKSEGGGEPEKAQNVVEHIFSNIMDSLKKKAS